MDEQTEIEQTAFDKAEAQSSPRPRRPTQGVWPGWIAPAWFLSGVLAGVIGFALFITLTTRPTITATAMREAARDGTLDAIATLQAGGPQPESSSPDAPTAQKAFALRDANRTGDKNARVTIVEFSDFQ